MSAPRPLTRGLRLATTSTAAVVVLVFGILLLRYQRVAERLALDAATSVQTMEHLAELEMRVVDAETDHRGFLLTRDSSFLLAYDADVAGARLQVAVLRSLRAGAPVESARLDSLDAFVERRFRLLDEVRADRARAGEISGPRVAESRAVMADLRALVRRSQAAESEIVARRQAREAEHRRDLRVVILLGTLLAGASSLLANGLLARLALAHQTTAGLLSAKRSELQRAVAAERETDGRLRLALSSANMGTWEIELPGGPVRRYGATDTIFGYEPTGEPRSLAAYSQRVHPEDALRIGRALAASAVGGASEHHVVYRVVRPDGSIRWVESRGELVRNTEGQPVRLTGALQDITERRETERRLVESEGRLSALADAGVIGILFSDIQGNIGHCNDEFLRMTGYGRADLDAGLLRWTDLTPAEYLDLDIRAIAEARLEGACTPYEKEYIRKDGTRVPILIGFVLLGEAREQATGFVLDLTERKAAEGEALRGRDAAERANRAKSQFLAVMSHELRTPLNAVIGYQDLMKAGIAGPLTEQQGEYLDRIGQSARHLLGLITEILDFARLEAGRDGIWLQIVDLRLLAQEAMALVSPQAQKKGLGLEIAMPDHPLVIETDAIKVRQILLNLLSNAVKFADDGRIDVELLTVEGETGGQAVIRVRDTGPGIPPEDLDRIWEPFTQVDQSATRRAGGTGLGLPVSRQLARLLGGTLHVESRPDTGSTFTLRLPLPADVAVPATSPTSVPSP